MDDFLVSNTLTKTMKLAPPKPQFVDREHQKEILLDLHARLTQKLAQRPCHGCAHPCTQCGSENCVCQCSAHCDNAAHQLSSEPHAHPIESGVLATVYELNQLGITQPVWSCHGHSYANGVLSRAPSIWFYAQSPLICQLIAEGLQILYANKQLLQPWRVLITSFGERSATPYSIEPISTENTELSSLQCDLQVIGTKIRSTLVAIVENRLKTLN